MLPRYRTINVRDLSDVTNIMTSYNHSIHDIQEKTRKFYF